MKASFLFVEFKQNEDCTHVSSEHFFVENICLDAARNATVYNELNPVIAKLAS